MPTLIWVFILAFSTAMAYDLGKTGTRLRSRKKTKVYLCLMAYELYSNGRGSMNIAATVVSAKDKEEAKKLFEEENDGLMKSNVLMKDSFYAQELKKEELFGE